jgi:hypothetical protein
MAPWSIAIGLRSPDLFVTALDLPEQLNSLQRAINQAGLGKRSAVIGANALACDLSSLAAQDVVLLANLCHVLDARRTSLLLRRATRQLRPGGALVVIDQVLDEEPDWTSWGAMYVVGAPHWMPGGFLHAPREYAEWLRDAGTHRIEIEPICAPPAMTMITAVRSDP